ncbi:MAG: hypothetical protein JXQ71_17585 [Verrucomicrobia bacterium]|nr:hypothetical protein [Verrucomicrobiota bacterium]
MGIYGATSTRDFAAVRAAGFNLVVGPAETAFLDEAHAAGLRVLATPRTTAGPRFNAAAARSAVRQFDAHPALWAWYVSDEPDLNRVPPSAVAAAHRLLKQQRARKPTALVLSQGYTALHYAGLTDLTMVDRYPIPWLPLANFGQHVEMARLALGPGPPLFAVIQAFDWTPFKHLLRDDTPLRPPTDAEMRCMTYEALARGATGLFYYRFESGWNTPAPTGTWAALRAIVREVRAREPLFQAEPLWWPREHAFDNPALRFNAALQSSITSTRLRVRRGNAEVPPGDYVLAVNNTTNHHAYWFKLPPPAAPEPQKPKGEVGRPRQDSPSASEPGDVAVPVLGEHRAMVTVQGWVRDFFDPYAVHVYGPLP